MSGRTTILQAVCVVVRKSWSISTCRSVNHPLWVSMHGGFFGSRIPCRDKGKTRRMYMGPKG